MATFDYTSRDYLSIRQDLVNRAARLLPEWNGNDASEFANVFVDLWAYMGDVLHFYVDRAASETFLETATQRESIIAIANLLDYIPASYRSARGTATLRLNSLPSGETSLTIPQYTSMTAVGSSGATYDFYTNTEVTMSTVGGNTSVVVVQGSITQSELLGTSSGLVNQRFTLVKKNVDVDSITILVFEGPLDGGSPTAVEYQYVAQLSTANYLDKVFTARLTSDGYTQIIFGNGFNGAIPTTNATIQASYRTSVGSEGNLPANAIKFISPTVSNYVSVLSSTATSGGANEESIESIKNNVSRLYRTQDRAVSLQDYRDLTFQVPGVSKASVVYDSLTSKVLVNPVVHQTSYPPAKTVDGVTEKVIIPVPVNIEEAVETYLNDRSMLGVSAEVPVQTTHATLTKYVECTPVYIHMTLNIRDNYVRKWVQDEVDKVLRELLSFENVVFDQRLTIGEVYRAALSIVGIDYVQLNNLSTTYVNDAVSGSVADIQASAGKLLCFSDDMSTGLPAIKYDLVGGLSGTS